MDTRLLKHFLAVYEHRHFGRAAEALDMSKQGLSKSVAKLEDSIDAKLFERGRFGVRPSEFGEALASHARLILAETRIAEDEIEGLKNAEAGEVRVGVTPTMSERIVPAAVSNFTKRSTKVGIYVVSRFPTELMDMLAEGDLDVVAGSFRPDFVIPENVNKETLFTQNDMIACRPGHPIAVQTATKKGKLKLSNLEPYPWLVPAKFEWVVDKISSTFQSAGLDRARDFIHSDDFSFMRGLLAESDYLCYGNRSSFSWEIDSGHLSEIFVPQLTDVRQAMLLTRRSSILTRAAVGLIQEIRETAKLTMAA